MRHNVFLTWTLAWALMSAIAFRANGQTPPPTVASHPVFVPDTSHSMQPLPDGLFNWNSTLESTSVISGADYARFRFDFTNVSGKNITIISVHPSCGCTTAELPPVPWTLASGHSGSIKLNVNLSGKYGTVFKSAKVTTDMGNKDLMMRITINPAPPIQLSPAQIQMGIKMAKADRQAVFRNDCATCHAPNVSGRYGQDLFNTVCAICHQAVHRATMVPDLSQIKTPTGPAFWTTWITYGKPGSLMPAFSNAQGGPLSDLQIASLAAYLNAIYPSKVASTH